MSVNRYSTESGLQTLANGQRIWIGTKAAYDAEKQAGTLPSNCLIAITDDSEDNNYSTEEKLTGKFWIDGKPIYRKTWTGLSVAGSSNDWMNVIPRSEVSDIETIISGFILCSSQGRKLVAFSTWQIVSTSNYIQAFASAMGGVTFDTATIEYTKTTD